MYSLKKLLNKSHKKCNKCNGCKRYYRTRTRDFVCPNCKSVTSVDQIEMEMLSMMRNRKL